MKATALASDGIEGDLGEALVLLEALILRRTFPDDHPLIEDLIARGKKLIQKHEVVGKRVRHRWRLGTVEGVIPVEGEEPLLSVLFDGDSKAVKCPFWSLTFDTENTND